MKKYHSYWTLERCKEDALKYASITEWQANSAGAYRAALRNKWVIKCCPYREDFMKPKHHWTLENCKKDAKKFKSRREWYLKGGGSYNSALKNKWIDECCSHMKNLKKPSNYWTLEHCKECALKFKTKIEWQTKSKGSYLKALRNKWIDECCGHMITPLRNRKIINKNLI